MDSKSWNMVLDHYLKIVKMKSEHYEMLDDEQRNIIQTLKRAFARINYERVAPDFINDKYKTNEN